MRITISSEQVTDQEAQLEYVPLGVIYDKGEYHRMVVWFDNVTKKFSIKKNRRQKTAKHPDFVIIDSDNGKVIGNLWDLGWCWRGKMELHDNLFYILALSIKKKFRKPSHRAFIYKAEPEEEDVGVTIRKHKTKPPKQKEDYKKILVPCYRRYPEKVTRTYFKKGKQSILTNTAQEFVQELAHEIMDIDNTHYRKEYKIYATLWVRTDKRIEMCTLPVEIAIKETILKGASIEGLAIQKEKGNDDDKSAPSLLVIKVMKEVE